MTPEREPPAASRRVRGRKGATPARTTAGRTAVLVGALAAVLVALAAVGGLFFEIETDLSLPHGGRVAVAPFRDATGAPLDRWIEVGLTERVAGILAEAPGVEVLPPDRLRRILEERGVSAGPDSLARIRQLAQAAGADLLMVTEIRKEDGGYVLELAFDGPGGRLDSMTLEADDLIGGADRLVRAAASALRPELDFSSTLRQAWGPPFVERLYGMGLAELRTAGPQAAKPYFEIATRAAPGFLPAIRSLAECAGLEGDLRTARRLYFGLLREVESRRQLAAQARILTRLGVVAALDGSYQEAEELLAQAEPIALSLDDRLHLLELRRHRARIALTRGETKKAEAAFFDLLEVQRGVGDRLGSSETLLQLAALALDAGQLDAAEALAREAEQAAEEAADPATRARVSASLGEVAWRAGDPVRASELWAPALDYHRARGHLRHQLLLTRKRAEAALRLARWEEAEGLFRSVVELSRELGEEVEERTAALRLAEILLRRGYPSQARLHLDRALSGEVAEPLTAQKLIAWLAYERGRFRLAVETQRAFKRQAGEGWTEEDEAFLLAFERAHREGRRAALPGEEGSSGLPAPAASEDDRS